MIDVIVDDGIDDLAIPELADITAAVRAACHAAGLDAEPELCIRFAADDEVRQLNRQWRHKDKVTDVLSFPMQEGPEFDPSQPLGDIVLAMPFVQQEADRLELPMAAHALHLIVHAVLHLLGHEHDADADAEIMQGLERNVLRSLGLHDPYPPEQT
ncbi:MAG TPA: rRNA maturation RNase YbeY [Mariprofundaceae bacterium]|nr:rRNA maturation RNase YbeY [Mariprofundaceae bacterium]